ncbi:sulfotransferase family protein [Flavisphingomonas formosensis]|uniref:sulfotransferase family protein n=1 Tax=Flavisphingomonas formosensis TaxID=861534 RepID=UPI0018E052F5|nr:sulfotransferase [Sphingomonas formosensis]
MANAGIEFDVPSLMAEARQRTEGLEDFGSGPFVEPLGIFVNSLARDARLNPIGQHIARERALGHIVNRLHYVEDRKTFPGIADERIVKPIFIIGFPRTGTTILHDILAQDPANRAPLTWEITYPSPPPMTASFETDPRIARCEASFPPIDERRIAFKAMHPMGAQLSQECVVMMGDAMCTPLFHNQFRVPSYQDWVDRDADWRSVYAFHRQQLQHLQHRHKGERWVLKTGAHLWGLEHLLETYPDARIVFTHRDPVKSLTSYASLTALVRTMGSDEVDRAEIAEDWTGRLERVLANVLRLRAEKSWPRAILYDVMFPDFVQDQFAVVEAIYRAFDLPMSEEGARRMKAFIADNPQGKHGIHRYSPEEYGIDPAVVRQRLRPYIQRFDLRPE